MKRRSFTKLLSCVLAFSMVATAAPVGAFATEVQAVAETDAAESGGWAQDAQTVKGEGSVCEMSEGGALHLKSGSQNGQKTAEPVVIPSDGAYDSWAQDPATVKPDADTNDAVNELTEDGWRHLKAGTSNGNAAGNAEQYPAMFVHPSEFDFTQPGFFEFELKPLTSKTDMRFGVYLDYKDPGNGMFLGYDSSSNWFWQKYSNGDGGYGSAGASAPEQDSTLSVRIEWTADGLFSLVIDGTKVLNNLDSELEHSANGKIALKLSTYSSKASEAKLRNIHYTGQQSSNTYLVSGSITDAAGKGIAGASVTMGGVTATSNASGAYVFRAPGGRTYDVSVTAAGYNAATSKVTVGTADMEVPAIKLEKVASALTKTLSTESMDVKVGAKFPYIERYIMKGGSLDKKEFYGQLKEINTIKINGKPIEVKAEDVTATFTDKKAAYVMNLKATDVDCVITAEITADKNTASFDITNVTNNLTEKDENGYEVNPVQTIEIPNHSLISVNSSQANAHLKGAKMSSNTMISGDKDWDITASTNVNEDFIYGFINNSEMSAGLWSNSEYQGSHVASYITAGGASNTRVWASTSKLQDGTNSLGLASTAWYYDRKITTPVNGTPRTYVVAHEIMPSAKVVITGDENGDGDIDWQDGAVAFRSIMHNPVGCEVVPELVNYRIAMNFGSMAANPFLMNLDGVKRVYLNTEGLGQGVLLKGYGSEGHDSGHPDYSDIGRRIGGVDDMKTLLQEGKKMGALFGIHVNCSEMYTEAKAFDDELSRHNYGWNWLDQGIGINGLFDLASGRRENRFKELHDLIGNDLDFIYVDVWGNNTSGDEDAWESRMLAREINGLGWRLATEGGPTQEYDSTLQHWAADLAYGGATSKGENSAVMRFLRNHQKDSWIADYPSYAGAAQSPLLGGLNMTDFEGWQGRADYENYITVMFRHNLITKFLQHYQVVDWKDGTPVSISGTNWTPEMEITLRNTEDPQDDTEIVVSRDSNDYSNLAQYRSRTIKVNGVTVSTGAPTGGDGSNAGSEKYLIPWNWDHNGDDLPAADQKLYHWSTNKGTSTWTLTDGWQGLSNVVVYRLTDEGKKDKKVVSVVNNTITLEAEAETPYVVFKGEKAELAVDWQTSKYVYDMGFNDTNVNSHRTVTGSGKAEIVDNAAANNMLKLEGDVSVSTQLTNLKAGQKYALYVGVDNRSDSNAYVTVTGAGNKKLGTNYAGRSFVRNLVSSDQHNTSNGATVQGQGSMFQNMFVFFTADGTTATLTMKRDAGTGATYFDDIRVVETKMDVALEYDKDGYISELFNDFEENAQGIWPFVVSGPGGVTDNRIHLSERHDRYTQAGYGVKEVDDVLDGDWSVKVNGLVGNNAMIYQTIPQNFHFKAGETYYVTFDYQMGSRGTYEIRLGDGTNNNVKSWPLPTAIGETKRYGISFTASESGNSWIGVFSTGASADTHGLSGGAVDFSGYKDIVLDNLKIEKGGMTIDKVYTETTTAKDSFPLSVDFINEADKDTEVTWASSDEDVVRVSKDGEVYFVGFGSAMVTATATVGGKEITLCSSFYMPNEFNHNPNYTNIWTNSASPEPKEDAIDGNPATNWHSAYSGGVSESNPAILTVQFAEDITEFETVAFQQRNSFHNGYVQKYECIVGDSFDASTHTIGGTDGTNRFTTGIKTITSTKAGEIVDLDLPEGTKGHYLQIRVLQGKSDYAAIAEIILNTVISYDTPEERAYFKANEALVSAGNELKDAQKELEDTVEAAEAIYKAGQKNYTDASWKAFKDAYEQAQAGMDSKDLAQLRKLKSDLIAAQGKLEEKKPGPTPVEQLDQAKKELSEVLAAVEAIYNAGQKNYTDASWAAIKAAYEAAKAGVASGDITTILALKNALAEAQKGLVEKPADPAIKKGDKFVDKKITYKVTNVDKKTVAVVKGVDKKSVTIPATVKKDGITFKVTEINASAFKNFKKLSSITIGKNIKTIGGKSFYKCSKLKKVTFTGTGAVSIKTKAFKGTNAKMKVQLPKKMKAKQKNSLKNALKKAGISSKAVIK